MGFGAIRSVVRPLSRTLLSRATGSSTSAASFLSSSTLTKPQFHAGLGCLLQSQSSWRSLTLRNFSFFAESNPFDRLTDTRYPKRRPVDKPRRKRSSLRPPGPYAWVKYEPGQPIQPNNPNKGSVKLRNEKKRRRQRLEFMKAYAKKRKAEMQEAKRKKHIKRVERKMAAVARERAWAERLAELRKLEEEKKKSMA